MSESSGIHYSRLGTGEPLVLVHGLGSRRQVWDPVLPEVAAHRDVVALDLPGFGASPGPVPQDGDGRASVAAFADAVAGLIERLGLDRPHLAGSSLGGGIALELGRRGLARSVTAFAPVGFWSAPGARWAAGYVGAARTLARTAAPVLPALAATLPGRVALGGLFFGKPWRAGAGVLLADGAALVAAPGFAAAAAAFETHRFPALQPGALDQIPVTLVWGTRDLVLPFATQGARARQALPAARRVVLPGAGHLPFLDEPQRCAEALLWSPVDRRTGRP